MLNLITPAIVPLLFSAIHLANHSVDHVFQLLLSSMMLYLMSLHPYLSTLAWGYVLPAAFFSICGATGALYLQYKNEQNKGSTRTTSNNKQMIR